MTLVYDLYCGHGGVGLALDELDVDFVGVDISDRSETYPGRFIRADASQPPLDDDADLVWASPPCTPYSSLSATAYGSAEAAREANPTIPELDVRAVADHLGAEYVIENVPRCDDLHDPTRLNGHAFGADYDLERWFETSFPLPDHQVSGTPSTPVDTRRDQSIAPLAAAKGVPMSWGKQGVRAAIPRQYVRYVLGYCPTVEEVAPGEATAGGQTKLVTDGGREVSDSGGGNDGR
jgi:hypothetical protein